MTIVITKDNSALEVPLIFSWPRHSYAIWSLFHGLISIFVLKRCSDGGSSPDFSKLRISPMMINWGGMELEDPIELFIVMYEMIVSLSRLW